MAPADPVMALLFIAFLVLFLAIGILPAWQRLARDLRALFRPPPAGTRSGRSPAAASSHEPGRALQLNDFELFILQRLAQAGARGLSRKQLQGALHFSPALVKATLGSLLQRDLVQMAMPWGFATHYVLAPQGRAFAVAQGYLPEIRQG